MSTTAMLRVMVVDDHDLFRDGIVTLLRNQPDIEVVGEAGDGLEALVLAQRLRPDVILLDINMPGTGGLEAARLIRQALPECYIIMLTVRDEDALIFEAIRSGAQGYLLKTIRGQQLIEMLRAAARGEAALTPALAARVLDEFRRLKLPGDSPHTPPAPPISPAPPSPPAPLASGDSAEELTVREQEILALIAAARADKEIAAALHISLYTVKAHVRSILAKLHVANRREAARRAQL